MFERVKPAAIKFLVELVDLLGGPIGEMNSAKEIVEVYNRVKSGLGSSKVVEILNLGSGELPQLEVSIRDAGRRLDLTEASTELDKRNATIAALRLLVWSEELSSRLGAITASEVLNDVLNEELGRKQIRALELILRSLIDQRFGSQESLERELSNYFGDKVIAQWKASADPGNLLSGTTFSELASLFVNKQEYKNYEKCFSDASYLRYLKEKRNTLQNYLEDVRRVRNKLAHNKAVSGAQLYLLDLYYQEIIEPIQTSFDEGDIKVDPSIYLEASASDLDSYFSKLSEDIDGIKDDIEDLKTAVEERFDLITETTDAIRADTSALKRKSSILIAGVSLLIGLGSAIYFTVLRTSDETQALKQDAANIKESTVRTEQSITELGESVESVSQSMSDIAQEIEKFSSAGGLISSPKTFAEFYHNGRLQQQRGELDLAMESYASAVKQGVLFVDPVLDLIDLAKARYGQSGALNFVNETFYADLPPELKTIANIQLGADPVTYIQSVKDGDESFAPLLALWVESTLAEWDKYDTLTMGQAKEAARKRIELDFNSGNFQKYFLDKIRGGALAENMLQMLNYANTSGQFGMDRAYISRSEAFFSKNFDLNGQIAITSLNIQDKIDLTKPIVLCAKKFDAAEPTCNEIPAEANVFTNPDTPWFGFSYGDALNWTAGMHCATSTRYTDLNGFEVEVPVLINHEQRAEYAPEGIELVKACAGDYYRPRS